MVNKVSEAIGLSLIPCTSSNITAFAHVYQKKWLYILFKNKVLYRYEGQDYQAFLSLLNAESKGKWVNENLVKPKIECKKWAIEGV